jgi:hypothetical protein
MAGYTRGRRPVGKPGARLKDAVRGDAPDTELGGGTKEERRLE